MESRSALHVQVFWLLSYHRLKGSNDGRFVRRRRDWWELRVACGPTAHRFEVDRQVGSLRRG